MTRLQVRLFVEELHLAIGDHDISQLTSADIGADKVAVRTADRRIDDRDLLAGRSSAIDGRAFERPVQASVFDARRIHSRRIQYRRAGSTRRTQGDDTTDHRLTGLQIDDDISDAAVGGAGHAPCVVDLRFGDNERVREARTTGIGRRGFLRADSERDGECQNDEHEHCELLHTNFSLYRTTDLVVRDIGRWL